MQPQYAAQFVRDMGCTPQEWCKWLNAALTDYVWQCEENQARVQVSNASSLDGVLHLHWRVLPERRIALLRVPRLEVHYKFENVDDACRTQFMRRLDLFMQRGGG